MMSLLHQLSHNGSLWLLLACLIVFAGVVVGVMTNSGSGISSHPYNSPYDGGELASDLPPESIGRAEIEPLLRRRQRRAAPSAGGSRLGPKTASSASVTADRETPRRTAS